MSDANAIDVIEGRARWSAEQGDCVAKMLDFMGIMRVRRTSNRRAKRVVEHPLALTTTHPLLRRGHVMATAQGTSALGVIQLRDRAVDLDALRRHMLAARKLDEFAKSVSLSSSTVRGLCHRYDIPTQVWKADPLSEADRAWVAACLDCEGTITAFAKSNKHRGRTRGVGVAVKVSMTALPVLQKLHSLCLGSLFGPVKAKRGHSDIYVWCLAANGCRYLLPQILPHLLLKRRQAEIVLQILDGNRPGKSMPNEQLIPLLEQIRAANQRKGTVPTASLKELRVPEVKRVVTGDHVPCACGCGRLLLNRDPRGKPRRFLHGHNNHERKSGGVV